MAPAPAPAVVMIVRLTSPVAGVCVCERDERVRERERISLSFWKFGRSRLVLVPSALVGEDPLSYFLFFYGNKNII
jgi:hypothetical protein